MQTIIQYADDTTLVQTAWAVNSDVMMFSNCIYKFNSLCLKFHVTQIFSTDIDNAITY